MAEKTKQHFVPKMLLKRYSWDGTHVNLCNIRESKCIKPVPYEPQCQKRYFYGKDKRLEDALGEIETLIDAKLNELVNACVVPLKKLSGMSLSDDDVRSSVLSYIFIQYTRTQMAKTLVDKALSDHFEVFKKTNSEVLVNSILNARELESLGVTKEQAKQVIDSLSIKVNNIFDHMFSVANEKYQENKHLRGVLLFNTSSVPFITSDNPVVNIVSSFPERVLSFFMPVTPAHCLFYYDEKYFKVEDKDGVISIFDLDEVAFINTLQCENCKSNVYLPLVSSDFSVHDILRRDSHGGVFFNHIKAISLREPFDSHVTIPLSGGFATRVDIT